MGGSTVANQPPVYGTLGVPSSATTPGDNLGSLTFPGPNGTFLLFGGTNDGSLGVRNALWQYNPASSEWTWLAGADTGNPAGIYGTQGVPSTTSQPPPRYSAPTWSDAAGKLYFFGGNSDPKGYNQALSDFWTYNSSTGAWTWIDGSAVPDSYGSPGTIGVPSPSNLPTSRSDSGSCSDNQGNFWMFGGGGPYPPLGNIAYFNDLWQYDPNTGNWTWYTGGMQGNQAGVYGVQGTPDAANTPGGRFYMPCWTDLNGKLWFFGGYGYDITGSDQGFLENNDLWTFDPVTHLWTWIGGSNTHNQLGVYGTLGQPASGNIPGARDDTTHWTDRNGDLWLFGGAVMNPYYGVPTVANDLWRYNIASGQWTWMSGDPSGPSGGPSIYGTLGVPAPGNTPSARDSAVTWVDSQGNLWLFGGFGYDSSGNGGNLSDLWRYQP
jgi:N-acetylneuraminic acid mutarotase